MMENDKYDISLIERLQRNKELKQAKKHALTCAKNRQKRKNKRK